MPKPSFQRARQPEQKQQRRREILAATAELFGAPERLRGDDAKLYVVRRGGLLAGATMHGFLFLVYWHYGVTVPALINLASSALWGGALISLRLGWSRLAIWVAAVEAGIHIGGFTAYYGIPGGYAYLIPPTGVAAFLFFGRETRKQTRPVLLAWAVLFVLAWAITPSHGPLVGAEAQAVQLIGVANAFYGVLASTAFAYYFTRATETAEEMAERARGQVVEAEKQALVGRLVAGILHEMNTPLGSLRSASDTFTKVLKRCRAHLDGEEVERKVRKAIDVGMTSAATVEASSARLARVVEGLQHFVSLDEADRQVVDVREGIDHAIDLLGGDLGGLEIEKDYPDAPTRVECFPGKLNRAFLSILENAVQATNARVRVSLAAGDPIEVRIEDDGHGIPNEELPSIFEFGFDKRGDRVSMRVGLPRSKQTIDELGGTIEIESTVGAGTSVVVRLPAAPS